MDPNTHPVVIYLRRLPPAGDGQIDHVPVGPVSQTLLRHLIGHVPVGPVSQTLLRHLIDHDRPVGWQMSSIQVLAEAHGWRVVIENDQDAIQQA